ncbi:MAG: alpha/beta hydrolase [Deltaproteobacteria bacterium]|nr:alpha/beta hydrolase [Deltaproteobacteria bacterium]
MQGSQPARSRTAATSGPVARRLELPGRGVTIALLDWQDEAAAADAPLVLMHHANGFCAGTLALVAQALTPAFRVIGMDARGHGGSSRPVGAGAYGWDEFALDALAVAEALAPAHGGRIAVGLGHSFGGTAMLGAAARRPALFERLVLVDPVLPTPEWASADPERGQRGARLVEGARRRRSVWASRAEARAHFAGRSLFRRWQPAALDAYVEHGLRERADGQVELACPGAVEATIFAAAALGLDVVDLARRAAPVPATVLWARHGDFPRAVFERVFAAMPGARLVDAEAGHLIPMERPELVVREVAAAASARAERSSPCAP